MALLWGSLSILWSIRVGLLWTLRPARCQKSNQRYARQAHHIQSITVYLSVVLLNITLHPEWYSVPGALVFLRSKFKSASTSHDYSNSWLVDRVSCRVIGYVSYISTSRFVTRTCGDRLRSNFHADKYDLENVSTYCKFTSWLHLDIWVSVRL